MSFLYKVATTALEFKEIHELNYKTFAEEIPQHAHNESQMLIDKFHDENTYIICKKEQKVIGMIAVRGQRPFSLDGKIGKVEEKLPLVVENPVEIRLLAIEPQYRNGRAFLGLAQALVLYCLKAGYDAALISGTTREQKLYGQLGFRAFAEMTGTKEALFQPMYLTKETFEAGIAGRILKPHTNFLPGPVTLSKDVQHALAQEPFSHRSIEYESLLTRVKNKLLTLTGAAHMQLFQGTGTLANDVVAGQLSLVDGKGLILVNGEFGTRLVDHASRFGMAYDTVEVEWGSPFDEDSVNELLGSGQYSWLWMVHSETSTGILNHFATFEKTCKQNNVVLALDCISSIGTVPLKLKGVAFASGVSGKALAAYTGLAFVFHSEMAQSNKRLPRYLDLGMYCEADGIPYSQSSNLLVALEKSLQKYEQSNSVFDAIEQRAKRIRNAMKETGIEIFVEESYATPAIITLTMPGNCSAIQLGDNLFMNGITTHYESSYLRERNWLQIASLNDVTDKEVDRMLAILCELVNCKVPMFNGTL